MSAPTTGRPEDPVIAALDDEAAYLSEIAGCVAVIAAHQPSRAIREELRRILAALAGARTNRIALRAAWHKKR